MKRITKTIFPILLFLATATFVGADAINTTDFVTTWKTDNPGTTNATSVLIPMIGGPYDVDWNNDGIYDQTISSGSATHDFGVPGNYTIRISSPNPQIRFHNTGDRQKILSIDQWGTGQWANMDNAFFGASNLVMLATDTPDTSNVTNMQATFSNASSFNGDISAWDVSNVTNMKWTFYYATSFNQDISAWDVSNVSDMYGLFGGASSFNQDISAWDISNVTKKVSPPQSGIDYMFYAASSFNQDISAWDVSNLTSMIGVFYNASAFNQDISAWNLSNVTNASSMLRGSGLSVVNYDKLLISWSNQTTQSLVPLGSIGLSYCLAEEERNNLISTYSWNITGDAKDCSLLIHESPDLQSGSDLGSSNTDNLTSSTTPSFDVQCTVAGNSITLYSDTPGVNTIIGTHTCLGTGTETITSSSALADGIHNITYTESKNTNESGHSIALSVTIKTNTSTPTITPVEAGSTTITGTGEDGTTITLTDITCTNAPVEVTGGVWSCTILPTDVPEKGETITAVATDQAGNTANGSYTIPSPSQASSITYSCKDPQATNYASFGRHQASLCKYGTTTTPVTAPTTDNPFGGEQCPSNQLITDNMKNGDTNGVYSSYNQGKVSQVSILQAHINRLLKDEYTQAAGPVDNYFRSKTKQGVERIQRKLNQLLPDMKPLVIDGIVGTYTKKAINMSC